MMAIGVYMNFEKEAREAMVLYSEVFQEKIESVTLYGDMPADPNHPIPEAAKSMVMNGVLSVHGMKIMFADVPDGMGVQFVKGSQITMVVDLQDEAILTREFEALSKGGHVVMPLGETFWSKKYGYLVDQFGIGWQFNLS